MDPISGVNPVLDALRKQLAENIERLRKSGKLAAAGAGRAAGAAAARSESLEAALGRKLSALDRRSPEGRAAATRAFIETALVAEFGQGLLSDPAFGDMVAELSSSLREDAELRGQLDRMLENL
jgi:hypothetical protein